MHRLLPLLLLVACGTDPAQPSVVRSCLATVDYRYVGVDTFSTGGAAAPEGGPLCIELAGDHAIVTSGQAVYLRVYVSSGGSGLWYLWPAGERAEARVFRDDGQLYLSATVGNLRWLTLAGMRIVEGPHGRLSMHYEDNDEVLHAEWVP